MRDKRPVDELSIEELERILAIRKREEREKRVRRMRENGRVIESAPSPSSAPPTAASASPSSPPGNGGMAGLAAVTPTPSQATVTKPSAQPTARPGKPQEQRPPGASGLDMPTSLADLDALLQTQNDTALDVDDLDDIAENIQQIEAVSGKTAAPITRFEDEHAVVDVRAVQENAQTSRKVTNRLLLLVEVAAVVGLFLLGVNMFTAISDLQSQTAEAQREAAAQRIALIPTPEPTSIIQVKLEDYLLPGGHVVENNQYSFNYAELEQYVPANLRDTLRAQVVSQSIEFRRPEISAEDAERLSINIGDFVVDQPIVPGSDDAALKEGVGRVLNGAVPSADSGNVVLAAHNDVYSALFSKLPQLVSGDRFVVQTRTKTYEYEVVRTTIVEPNETWVMEDQGYPSVTLITCITQRTINDSRYIVFARRVDA